MQDIYIDTSICGFWHGTLTGLRLDPIENQGACFELAQIELLEGTPKVKMSGFVNSLDEKVHKLEQRLDDLESTVGDLESIGYDAEDEVEELRSELEALAERVEALENEE